MLTGRIVDSYTNILTVKLFARARDEDAYVREAVDEHTGLFHASLRLNTLFSLCLSTAERAAGHRHRGRSRSVLWTRGAIEVGAVAMALPLAWQIVNDGRLGRLAGHRHLREYRRGAGGHGGDRAAARARRPAGREPSSR